AGVLLRGADRVVRSEDPEVRVPVHVAGRLSVFEQHLAGRVELQHGEQGEGDRWRSAAELVEEEPRALLHREAHETWDEDRTARLGADPSLDVPDRGTHVEVGPEYLDVAVRGALQDEARLAAALRAGQEHRARRAAVVRPHGP